MITRRIRAVLVSICDKSFKLFVTEAYLIIRIVESYESLLFHRKAI